MLGILRLLLSLLVVLVTVFGCTHTSSSAPPSAEKPYENCICGPLSNTDQEPFCAIWGREKRLDGPQPVYQAEAGSSCLPQDCGRFFSRYCKAIQMAPPLPKVAPVAAALPPKTCYCDQVLIENEKGQALSLCAAWAEGGTHLIEYYALDSCAPTRCKETPFYKAKAICGDNFQSFYTPLPQRH